MKDLREQFNLPIIRGTRVVPLETTDRQRQRDAHILITGKTHRLVCEVINQFKAIPDTVYCELQDPYSDMDYLHRFYWQSMGVLA